MTIRAFWNRRSSWVVIGGAVLVVGVIVIGFVVVAGPATGRRVKSESPPSPQFVRHSLANANPAEIGQAAIAYVQSDFQIRSGTPTILLSKLVMEDELPALGLGRVGFAASVHPPLALVILKGDFGQGHILGANNSTTDRYTYIGYIFDLWAGTPTETIPSYDGGIFRQALGDPTLPIVPTIPAGPPQPTSAISIPYGGVAPTVALGHALPAPTPVGLPAAPHP